MKKYIYALAAFVLLFACTGKEEEAPVVKVQSITIEQSDMTLTEGESVNLSAKVLPENAADKTVSWSSSNESVVMVSSNGKAMALSLGKAIITAKSGDKSDFITITVEAKVIPVTGVSLDKTQITIKVGESETLTPTITPEDATNKKVSWTSSNDKVATVEGGKVVGVQPGSVTITVTTEDGAKTAECPVTVKSNLAPSVTVGAEHISAVSAVLSGKANLESTVASDLKVGFQYSKSAGILPSNSTTIEATDADADYNYTTSITGLEPDTKYYFRSFVRQNGQDTYGETKEFATKDVASLLETRDASGVEATKATLNAKLDLTDVQYKSLAYGFLWGSSESALNADFKCTEIKDNAIAATLTSLSHKTQYWYKAYVKLDDQTFYGEVKTFTTDVVPVESISLDKTEHTFNEIGSSIKLEATVLPLDATDKRLSWKSDNPGVVSVDDLGRVTAIHSGTATVTVTTIDQGKTATCAITVINNPTLQNAWKIEYQGRGVYTEDGSNDTIEIFKLTYTGQAYYIIRMVDKGSVTDLAKFFNEEASALSNDFAEDVNNVFNDSRVVSFDLLLHGEYDVYMIEISQKKKATMSYQKASIEVIESEASADYVKWIGRWRVSDGHIGYDIDIEHAENNLLYYVWGWESSTAAMNQDMGSDWLFVRYDPVYHGLAFYVQTIGEDNDPDGSRFDKVFVGTWTESSGEVVDDLEGAVIARSGKNEKGELALIPETVKFDNGAMYTYRTMRYSSYSYNDRVWYHYNANVPSLYKLVNKVMTYPLTMTQLGTKSSLSLRLGSEPDRQDSRFKAKVHGSAQRRPVR